MATSDKPAPGRVSGELSLRDLELYMSNREARFGGDWDKAMLALAHDIDPGGAMKLWTAPPPMPTNSSIAITEGGLSYHMLYGVPYAAAVRANRAPRTLLRDSDQTGALMAHIVWTVARINKYGEPEFGLRKALFSVAQFLINDLARKPPPPALSPGEAQKSAADALAWEREAQTGVLSRENLALARAAMVESNLRGSRAALYDQLETTVRRGSNPAPQPYAEEDKQWGKEAATLPLDDFDLANAALDILVPVDQQGRPKTLLSYREYHQGGVANQFTSTLSDVAARRGVVGGPATVGSPLDVVACKAFAVLAALVDYRSKEGASWQQGLWSLFLFGGPSSKGIRDAGLPVFRAQRAALIAGGFGDANNALNEAQQITGIAGLDSRAVDAAVSTKVPTIDATIRDFMTLSDGPARAAFIDAVNRYFEGRRADPDYKAAIKYWDASRPDMDRVTVGGYCAPPPTPPRIVLIATGNNHDFIIDKIYVGVPTAILVVFDEPYDGDAYPVSIKLGGSKTELSATPVDDQRRIYKTQNFVPVQ